ncbi:MAG: glutathione S-transferase family protein [Myxococcota bacterium]
MPSLKLSYFDFNGGRGEVARIAFSIGGVEFDDDRFAPRTWPERKADTLFGCVPELEVDGQRVTQSNGINRYAGKLAGLYPEDPFQAALCDEAMDVIEEIAAEVKPTFSMKDEAQRKAAREALVAGSVTRLFGGLGRALETREGGWFADGRLTVADLKVFLSVRHVRKGGLDHVPADLFERIAPALVDHFERVESHPGVVAYYESRQ